MYDIILIVLENKKSVVHLAIVAVENTYKHDLRGVEMIFIVIIVQ